ncbi:hypothetical protein ACFRLW_24200 [Streptomyces sp. NPDC056728]
MDLYDNMAEEAEYLQAESQDRHMLPEAVILSALGAVLGAFASGMFQRLGEKTAEGIASKVSSLLRRASRQPDRVATLESLELMRPYLPELLGGDDDQRLAEEKWVSDELESRGFPAEVARGLARRLLDDLRRAGGAS